LTRGDEETIKKYYFELFETAYKASLVLMIGIKVEKFVES